MDTASECVKLVVASTNPVKINAAKSAFEKVLKQPIELVSLSVESGVPDQPLTTNATKLGAYNRVIAAKKSVDADYYIAYEGGVDMFEDGPKTFAVICIAHADKLVYGQSATLPLPMHIYKRLLGGAELGEAMDDLFNTVNIKQRGGAIGQLTAGLETRGSIYESATILSLSPFANAPWYAG